MAGIYVHIPFCKSRCVYCGFYSTTQLDVRGRYVDAVCREWHLRRSYINNERVHTIYVGGGTPSQLDAAHLRQLFATLGTAQEVTLECNPDDVTPQFADLLGELPVNRVSMGVQSFSDERLRFARRRHTSVQVHEAVSRLRQAGIGNVSIDLMYGFPGETLDDWHRDVDEAVSLRVEHLSAYALMYEEGTPLYRLLEAGQVSECDEELSRQMYYLLKDTLAAAGYEHYEISNFARPGFRSRHNSSYWNATPYIGLGAAAHSFDGSSRQWNVADVGRYMAGIERGEPYFEREVLDAATRYNERVMTALRTCEGLPLSTLTDAQRAYCLSAAAKYVADGLLLHEEGHLRLSRRGLFVSDMIMSDLMLV